MLASYGPKRRKNRKKMQAKETQIKQIIISTKGLLKHSQKSLRAKRVLKVL